MELGEKMKIDSASDITPDGTVLYFSPCVFSQPTLKPAVVCRALVMCFERF